MIGQPRSTQRYQRIVKDDEAALTADIIRLASEFGRYGVNQRLKLDTYQRVKLNS